MRSILLTSLVQVISFIIIAGAAEVSGISAPNVTQVDSITHTFKDSSCQPIILEENQDYYLTFPNQSQLSSPSNSGIILDVPDNDDCSDALEIGDVQDLPLNVGEAMVSDGGLVTLPDVWYLYTASTTSRVQVITDGLEWSESEAAFAIYEGSVCPEFENFPSPTELQGGETIETATEITEPLPVVYTGTTEGYDADYEFYSCRPGYSAPDVV